MNAPLLLVSRGTLIVFIFYLCVYVMKNWEVSNEDRQARKVENSGVWPTQERAHDLYVLAQALNNRSLWNLFGGTRGRFEGAGWRFRRDMYGDINIQKLTWGRSYTQSLWEHHPVPLKHPSKGRPGIIEYDKICILAFWNLQLLASLL